MSEWKEYKIDLIAKVIGGGTPKTSRPEFWNGNIPWLTPRDLTGYSKVYIQKGERNITEEGLKGSSAKLLPAGTVLLSSRAPIGYIAIAGNEICTNQGFKSLIVNKDKANNLYIYYWLKSNVEYIKSNGTGTTFSEISGSVLKELDILLPPLTEQKAIAEVLSSLDDKIDLLHRQNKTLEEMAETLFRQWFIEERDGSWEEKPLGELFEIGSGKGLKKDKFNTAGKYPVLGANGSIGKTNEFLFNEKLIYTGRVGTLGNIFRINKTKVWLSDNTLVIKPKDNYNFIYFTLKNAKLGELNVGSTQPLIRQSDLKVIPVFISNEKKHIEFEETTDFLFDKIDFNISQIHSLVNLRDSILPKLMNGEIKVRF